MTLEKNRLTNPGGVTRRRIVGSRWYGIVTARMKRMAFADARHTEFTAVPQTMLLNRFLRISRASWEESAAWA
jgi:hypothetical protein